MSTTSAKYVEASRLLNFKNNEPQSDYDKGWNDALDSAYNLLAKEMPTDVSMPGMRVVKIEYVENLFMDGGDYDDGGVL